MMRERKKRRLWRTRRRGGSIPEVSSPWWAVGDTCTERRGHGLCTYREETWALVYVVLKGFFFILKIGQTGLPEMGTVHVSVSAQAGKYRWIHTDLDKIDFRRWKNFHFCYFRDNVIEYVGYIWAKNLISLSKTCIIFKLTFCLCKVKTVYKPWCLDLPFHKLERDICVWI